MALSSIRPDSSVAEDIELAELTGDLSGVSETGNGFVDIDLESVGSVVSDRVLLEDDTPSIRGVLVVGRGGGTVRAVSLPDSSFQRVFYSALAPYGPAMGASTPAHAGGSVVISGEGAEHPSVLVYGFSISGTFDLHPSLLRRKRKRRYASCFPDGIVDQEYAASVPAAAACY
nr:L2 protein [Equus caballus papillomavirus 9]